MITVNTDASVLFTRTGMPAWAGFVVYDRGYILHQHVERVAASDPVHAELHGLRLALEYLGGRKAVILTDCQAVSLYAHRKRCKNPEHKKVLREIQVLLRVGQKVRWIPREKNKEADRLCRQARKVSRRLKRSEMKND